LKIFGHKISLNLKIRKITEGISIDEAFQKKVLGSNSQYLEDIHLDSIFKNQSTGSYIDIGANDPVIFNNTKLFYDKGWRGINIEPNRQLYDKFCCERPDDTNLNLGISDSVGELTFYEMTPHTLSTFNKFEISENIKKFSAKVVSETKIPVTTLNDIYVSYVKGKSINFMSIDTEGFEHQVIAGNNWEKFRPAVIIIEIDHDRDNSIYNILKSLNYELFLNNGINCLFADKKQFS